MSDTLKPTNSELPEISTLSTQLKQLATLADFELWKRNLFGKQGLITGISKSLKDLNSESKMALGQALTQWRQSIEPLIQETQLRLNQAAINQKLETETLDLTASIPATAQGNYHPLTLTNRHLQSIFTGLGYITLDGYELETDDFNFGALNIPADHPARDEHDTFYLKMDNQANFSGQALLRTHTSPAQVRLLRQFGAPLRAIIPGRVYRNEATDETHDHTFHQCEGFLVDKNISVANLIATIDSMLKGLFGLSVEYRLRPNHFPFVEPGFEVDMKRTRPDGSTGWLEILGCGLIHPHVIKAAGLDPEIYSGFAFGLGVTRLCLLQFGINDIRLLLGGNIDFNRQFTQR